MKKTTPTLQLTKQFLSTINVLLSSLRSALLAGAVLFSTSGSINAQNLIVGTVAGGLNGTGTVGTYTLAGTPVSPNLITGQSYPVDLAVTPTHIYVVNRGTNSIGKYNIDGTVVNAAFITGLNDPQAIAIQGSDIYVANAGNAGTNTVGKYTTAGATVNAAFITVPSNALGVAVSGTDLYVAVNGVPGMFGTVAKFTTAGVLVNDSFLTGLVQPRKMVVSGSDLFLIHGSTLSVGKYNTTTGAGGILLQGGIGGTLINVPINMVISGSDLYVASLGGGSIPSKIGHYTTTGATVNAELITGLNGPYAIGLVAPVNLTIATYIGLTVTGPIGSTYTIEYTDSLTPPINWMPLTSGTLTTSSFLYIDTSAPPSSRFYRAVFQ